MLRERAARDYVRRRVRAHRHGRVERIVHGSLVARPLGVRGGGRHLLLLEG